MNTNESNTTTQGNDFKHRAFIAHSQTDAHWGEWLQKALGSYRVPKRLVGRDSRDGTVPKRLIPIYRDTHEITDSSDIGATRRNLLQQSRYLIVICSPSSATSPWVNEEVLEFKRLGRENRILCLIVDGEPNATDKINITEAECFCEALRYKTDANGQLTEQHTEPIAADLRPGKDGKDASKLKILAGLLGVSFDDLRQRDLRRRRWRRIQTGIILVAVIISIIFLGIEANRMAQEKVYQRTVYAAQESRRLLDEGDIENAIQTALTDLPTDYSDSDDTVVSDLVWTIEAAIHQVPLQSILRGHTAEILNTKFSPDGQRLLTAARDWTVRIWDVDSGTEIAKHSISYLPAVTFSPSGNSVASADFDNNARIWDSSTGQDITILSGHEGMVLFTTFNSQGDKLLTGSEDGTARLWNVKTGEQIALFPGHEESVDFVAFNGSEEIVVTMTSKIIRFWDVNTGKPISVIDEYNDYIITFAQTATGEQLVTVPFAGHARLWDIQTGTQMMTLGDKNYAYRDVAFDTKATKVATAASVGTYDYSSAQLWDVKTGKQLSVLRGHKRRVISVAFNPSGTTVITGSEDGTARLWNARTGDLLSTLRGHKGNVQQVAFSPSGDRIVTASADGTARLWGAGAAAAKVDLSNDAILIGQQVAFDSAGKRIIKADSDNTAVVLDVETGETIFRLIGKKTNFLFTFVAFDPSGERIITASSDSSISYWDARTGKLVQTYGLKIVPWKSALSPKGNMLVISFFDDSRAGLWRLDKSTLADLLAPMPTIPLSPEASKPVFPAAPTTDAIQFHGVIFVSNKEGKSTQGDVQSVNFNPNGDMVAIAYAGKKEGRSANASVWDVGSQKRLFILSGHRETVRSAYFSPAGNKIVTASEDGTVRLWQIAPEELVVARKDIKEKGSTSYRKVKQLSVMHGHTDDVLMARFNPAGDKIVSASSDGTAKIWDVKTGAEIITLSGHTDEINEAVFSPSGEIIATASDDRTVRLWEVATGKMLNVFRGHTDYVSSVQFSPSGREVLTISNGMALLWDVQAINKDDLISRAQLLMKTLGY